MWSSWKTMQVMLWGEQGSIAYSGYVRALAGEIDICNITLWTVEGEQCISLFALAHDCYVADDAGYF